MKTFKTMLKTELKLSLRGMDMFIFAICIPVAVIVLLGIIYGKKPAFEGAEYTFLQQSFGAVSTIAIGAGGLMGLPLVVSDYRNRKIYSIYALASLALIYITAFCFFDFRMVGSFAEFLLSFLLVMLSMFSIGMMVGGIAPNIKMAGTIASILYFPMLIFSGATLPYEIMPAVLQRVADILPLTQGIKLLKGTSLDLPLDNIFFPVVLMVIIIVVCTGISLKFFKWE